MSLHTIIYDDNTAGIYIGGADRPVSARTLQRWRFVGIGPKFLKLGRMVRYRRSDLDAYIDGCTRLSSHDALVSQIRPHPRLDCIFS